jgi:hypothetical protein
VPFVTINQGSITESTQSLKSLFTSNSSDANLTWKNITIRRQRRVYKIVFTKHYKPEALHMALETTESYSKQIQKQELSW